MVRNAKSDQVRTVVVIGAGVIGLSSAIKLQDVLAQRKMHGGETRVLLVSREWPSSIPGSPSRHSANYASMWAGAHVRPIPATTPQLRREAKWLQETVSEFGLQVQAEPWCGITRTMGVELLEAPGEGYQKQDAESFSRETRLPRYRKWSDSELPANISLAFEYETYCVNSPLYCQSLLRKFILRGGRTFHRDLKSEWEAFGIQNDITLVINASGTGFYDAKYFPTRGKTFTVNVGCCDSRLTGNTGQTVVTNMTHVTKTVTRQNKDGTWNFIIPRFFSGGTIIGGTKQPGDWSIEPDLETRNTLLAAGRGLESFASTITPSNTENIAVIADVVGRRPTREGGMRIELEQKSISGREAAMVHAYGAGGRGYEISWGVANEVAKLAGEFLNTADISKL